NGPEEFSQDASIKLWERWDHVSVLDDPTGYLFRTAMNIFHNRTRRAGLAVRKVLGLIPVADDLAAVEDRDELVRLLRRMTPHQRAAIVLMGYLGCSAGGGGWRPGLRSLAGAGARHEGPGRSAFGYGGTAMIEDRERFERERFQRTIDLFGIPEPSFERLVRRRTRRKRNR